MEKSSVSYELTLPSQDLEAIKQGYLERMRQGYAQDPRLSQPKEPRAEKNLQPFKIMQECARQDQVAAKAKQKP